MLFVYDCTRAMRTGSKAGHGQEEIAMPWRWSSAAEAAAVDAGGRCCSGFLLERHAA